MPLLGGILQLVANLVGAYLLGRRWPWIRLDVVEDVSPLFARDADVVDLAPSYSGVIRVDNPGRVRFTVNGAGWLAADGETLEADLPTERTLEPGGPELHATISARALLAFAREHRGLTWGYVQLAGEDRPRRRRVDHRWRTQIRDTGE